MVSWTFFSLVLLLLAATATEAKKRKRCPHPEGATPPASRKNSEANLAALRRAMEEHFPEHGLPVDAYIVTSNDEHQSEYLSLYDRRREFLTGFTGSNGVAVVTRTRAALWTDGRYELQADEQLDCQWDLKTQEASMADWLALELEEDARVGVDPRLLSHHAWVTLENQMASHRINLVEVANLVDKIWLVGRPPYPPYKAYVHNLTFSGMSWTAKVRNVRNELDYHEADAIVVTSLDEVAWLFNVRGYDIQFTPVLRAFVIVSLEEIHMYVESSKLSSEVKMHLRTRNCHSDFCVRLHPYDEVLNDLRTFTQEWNKILLPAPCAYDQGASHAIYMAVQPPNKRFPKISPILFMKAQKNMVESHGMRMAHIRDAAAFCDFMAYLEERLADGEEWTEMKIAQEIDRFRGEQLLSRGPSFETIAGYGPNGALPHYHPTNATNLVIRKNSTLVLDSGGQYYDGTTDVTRTLHFGEPTSFQKEVYTRVLIGSIQLASLVFPSTIKMSNIDVLARGPLWSVGLDFNHGTGHGIGSFLSVHESPVSIVYTEGNLSFEKGYFFSDEPGYYQEGQFGVRLENILEVEERQTKHHSKQHYLGFRPVTLIPYEPKLINIEMLSKAQRSWLNEYNSQIRHKVGAELKYQRRMKGFHWMMSKTGYVPEHCLSRSSSSKNEHLVLVHHLISISVSLLLFLSL